MILFELFLGKLESIIFEAATKWAKRKLIQNAQVIALLKKVGYERLEDDFECIYAHCLATFAAESKPRPLLDIFKEKSVISAFQESWRTGELSIFSEQLKRTVKIHSQGDQVKALGIDINSEIATFHTIFMEFVQKARSPGNQEIAVILSEVRDILKTPLMSPELNDILDSLYKYCHSKKALVTRAHLFHRLLMHRLNCFREPILGRIKNMLEDFSMRLESDSLTNKGYGVTDSVNEVICLAQSKAKEMGATEFGIERLLLTLLDNPGKNILKGMSKYDVDPQEIIASLRQSSPDLF